MLAKTIPKTVDLSISFKMFPRFAICTVCLLFCVCYKLNHFMMKPIPMVHISLLFCPFRWLILTGTIQVSAIFKSHSLVGSFTKCTFSCLMVYLHSAGQRVHQHLQQFLLELSKLLVYCYLHHSLLHTEEGLAQTPV